MADDWVVCDVLEDAPGLARAATGMDVILCLSGVVPGRDRGRDRGCDLSRNITLAEAAIRAGHAGGARVILASSAAVYGNQAISNPNGVLAETAPLCPINDYGRAKAEMEARGAALGAGLGVAVTALRIGNIAGLDAILGGWREGFALDRFPDGSTPRRSYIGLITLARVLGDLVATDTQPDTQPDTRPDTQPDTRPDTRPDGLPDVLNVAAPGVVEMGALLDMAGLPWVPRAPDDTAIPRVCLSTRALERFTTLRARDGSAETLVKEWRAMTEAPE